MDQLALEVRGKLETAIAGSFRPPTGILMHPTTLVAITKLYEPLKDMPKGAKIDVLGHRLTYIHSLPVYRSDDVKFGSFLLTFDHDA